MNNPLLQQYVTEGSEPAFAELVRQHIGMVYSAALRQVYGDASAAQDVTQTVFTDLARKAPSLVRHSSLTGWLYTSTRYLSAKRRRADQRRIAREQKAFAMNTLSPSAETPAPWEALRPVLDEVMHELDADDREAVLLRYFEKRPNAEIGIRLGLTEETARKRVARALEKLRQRLERRGITSTITALSIVLTEQVVSAVPNELAGSVAANATSVASAGVGGIALIWKLLAGATAVTGAVFFVLAQRADRDAVPPAPALAGAQVVPAATGFIAPSAPAKNATVGALSNAAETAANTNQLLLHIVTADSGQPVPSVELDYWVWENGKVEHNKSLHASRQGVCVVPVPRATITQLILVSERDGFADTRLQWHPDHGETIPQEYTLRLTRAVSIGGTVLDQDGNPVAGCEVGFNNRPDVANEIATETDNFGWPYWISTETDASGKWQLHRISPDCVKTLSGMIRDPAHTSVGMELSDQAIREQALAGTLEVRLGRALEVHGTVVDASGRPVANARVHIGYIGMSGSREVKSNDKGQFRAVGCKPEKTVLTAMAGGFAPTTIRADLTTNTGPYVLTVAPGQPLFVLVQDAGGKPVANATLYFLQFPHGFGNDEGPPPLQTDFETVTGSDGRAAWSNAPERALTFSVDSPGQARADFTITPDGREHLVTLQNGLTISGTVRDAVTGALIPKFRLIAGWPTTNPVTHEVINHWSSIDRFWASYEGGTFRHTWTETPLRGTPNPGFIFKIEADGYAPFVSRPVALEEGEARFDVTLNAATNSEITVTLPDGLPAAGTDVALISPGAGVTLIPGGFSRANSQSGGVFLTTDSRGHFTMAADDTVTEVVAVAPQGYVETTPAVLAGNPTMVLQPWGRLEGTFEVDGKPVSNISLAFKLDHDDYTTFAADFTGYQVKTDASGGFVFAQVPPGHHQLAQVYEINATPGLNGKAWTATTLTNVDISPGETTTVNVQGATDPRPNFHVSQARVP